MLSGLLSVLPWLAQKTILSPSPPCSPPAPSSSSRSPSPPTTRDQSPPPDDTVRPKEDFSDKDPRPIQPDQLLPIPGASCPFPLPRPAYVRLQGEKLPASLGALVWKLQYGGNWMIVKGGPCITSSEAEMTAFVRARTSIPVPQVYGVVREGDSTYIYFEYVDGEPLSKIAPQLGSTGLSSVATQLGHMLDDLHSIVAPPGTAMGSLDGSNTFAFRCRGHNADLHDAGAAASTSALIDKWLRPRYLGEEGKTADGWAAIEAHLDRSAPLVFIHGDIWAGNVLVSTDLAEPVIVAIIDWECAGYYPEWVEYKAPARRAANSHSLTATKVMMGVCGRAVGFSKRAQDYEWIKELRRAF